MPSFDIVSKTDMAEVDNAIQNASREMSQRYDFKGSASTLALNEDVIDIFADDDLKLRQVHELLQGHLAKRKIDPAMLDYQKVETARGELGVYVVSEGGKSPFRLKFRSPGFSNLFVLDHMAVGSKIADLVAMMSTLDLVVPDIDR